MSNPSSKTRYQSYLQEVSARRQEKSGSADGNSAEQKTRQRTFWQLLSAFWMQLAEHRPKVLFALFTLTISTLLSLIPPAGTKFAIDYVMTEPPQPMPPWLSAWLPSDLSRMGLLWIIAIAVCGVTLVRTVVHLAGRWYATKAVNMVQADIRRRVFEHSMRLPLHRIQELKSGGATSLIREDAGGIADLIFHMLYNPWQAIIQLVGSLTILVLVDWRLMLGGLLLLPVVWLTHRTWIHRVRPLYKDIRSRRQKIDATTTETFGGIRIVRTFARNKSESSRFTRSTHLLARQQLMVWWSTRIIEVVWEVLIPLASTGLLLYGGWQILNHSMTLGDLMMFLVYLTMLLGPIASIASSAMSFQNNLAGLDRVLDLMDEANEPSGNPGAITLARQQVSGELVFNQVSFRYPAAEQNVLHDVSFTAPAGATVALVGRSGAGKTTLCNLVARFYQPSGGSIELDGRDVRDIHLDSYRKLLGVVEQDVFLFDGTVLDNIAYGRRGATEAEIVEASVAAAAFEFIEALPEGFNTWIGERGVKLSGGQRQRLAIARALLADPRILILDEATSNLDSESERLIQNSLKRLLHGRTAFVIAHRLSTIMHADLILVLDEGRIAEQGTHAELLEQGGLYQRMVVLQTESVPLAQ
ncbi:ABC transporter ATP-binding protein [Aureliella helgolandensis]|uniref:Multidrug export ATP-binding/permease protein n=1 Tax=Aureliella helgolandensis TaxID=2527968 RepID=A0A518GGL2_9BACT|nr:ABC transporter ATP-binding protein [Aureliella helgolandensis]QDV27720.1 Putative multidrug export ATP-binding/permease protein [Aureliella helgolandensis]